MIPAAPGIRKSIEGSLKRLRTDHIDLYFQARIDPNVEPEEVAETMRELIQEDKILHWGLSEVDEVYLRRAHAVCPVTAVENHYNIIDRTHEALIPFLEQENIGWVAHWTDVQRTALRCLPDGDPFHPGRLAQQTGKR